MVGGNPLMNIREEAMTDVFNFQARLWGTYIVFLQVMVCDNKCQ